MTKTFESRAQTRTLAVLAAVVFGISLVAVGNAVSAAPALDLVQVGLQTSQSHPYQYSLTAYNTSGYEVASYQSSYPGAAFQLPSGTYLLTASAYYQNSTYCLACMMPMAAGASTGAASTPIVRPIGTQFSEYGYSLTQVNGPTSIVIDLRNASALPLTQLAIHVGYANGTAAAGASVSAYVVGSYYVYSPKAVSYGQTDKSGDVTLTMPQAPVDVSAYLSMPIKLPRNTSTVTVNVGGQEVNVTVYLQPSYLSLNGEALILPPQASANIVLHYQPQTYPFPVVYAGTPAVTGAGGAVSSLGTGPSGPQTATSTNQTEIASRIAPFNPGGVLVTTRASSLTGSQGTSGASGVLVVIVAVGGAVILAVAVSALFMRKKRNGAPLSQARALPSFSSKESN